MEREQKRKKFARSRYTAKTEYHRYVRQLCDKLDIPWVEKDTYPLIDEIILDMIDGITESIDQMLEEGRSKIHQRLVHSAVVAFLDSRGATDETEHATLEAMKKAMTKVE